MQGLRDTIEVERSQRRAESNSNSGLIESGRHQFELEMQKVAAFEDRHNFEIQKLGDRIDQLTRKQVEVTQDWGYELKRHGEKVSEAIRVTNHEMMRTRAAIDGTSQENAARLQQLEDRCSSLENRISETATRLSAVTE